MYTRRSPDGQQPVAIFGTGVNEGFTVITNYTYSIL